MNVDISSTLKITFPMDHNYPKLIIMIQNKNQRRYRASLNNSFPQTRLARKSESKSLGSNLSTVRNFHQVLVVFNDTLAS